MRPLPIIALAVTAIGVSATPVLAHTGGAPAASALAGFLHPLTGFDHVLTMVAVGTMAALVGGRAMWSVPCAFVAVMMLGAVAGTSGVGLPMVELGIAVSLVALGVATAIGRTVPEIVAVALAGVFAVFHGHAHGSEMGMTVSAAEFGAGFVVATAALHAAGLFAALMLSHRFAATGTATVRLVGVAIASVGVGMVGAMI